jgi:integrase
MPRPPAPPHAIQPFFKLLREEHYVKLGDSTEKKYLRAIRRMEKAFEENPKLTPEDWLAAEAKGAARATIGVLRSAILYYLRWKHYEEKGEVLLGQGSAQKLTDNLTPTRVGKKGEERRVLTKRQFAKYQETVAGLVVADQIKAVLQLLPLTGLRISEACSLKESDIIKRGDEWVLDVIGKGEKRRLVPLGESARLIIREFLGGPGEGGFLFQNPTWGSPGSTRNDLSPAQVRTVVRENLQKVDGLEDVVPHVLRHQFATTAIHSGMALVDAKAVLGHSKMETLERYLHSTEDTVREGMNKIEEAMGKKD